jgi:hypothetical protein
VRDQRRGHVLSIWKIILAAVLAVNLGIGTADAGLFHDMEDVGKGVVVGAAVHEGEKVVEHEAERKTVEDRLMSSYSKLRSLGVKDGHHIIQDASVRDIPRYNRNEAPAIRLDGPSTKLGTEHNIATKIQREPGGGSYSAERRIAYKALRKAKIERGTARRAIEKADSYFSKIGVKPETPTRIPGNRK